MALWGVGVVKADKKSTLQCNKCANVAKKRRETFNARWDCEMLVNIFIVNIEQAHEKFNHTNRARMITELS